MQFSVALAHKFGRKRILSVSLLILVITLGASLAPNLFILLTCRFIMGFAIGMDSPVAFTFIAEISNKWQKGRNVNYWQVVWYVAIVVSALVVIAFFVMGTGEHLWRFAVGFGAFIALVLYILRIKYLKESPTWIINHHTLKEATEYVRNNYDVNLKLEGNGTSFSENKSSKPSTTELFKPKYLKRIVLATSISTLQGMQYYGVDYTYQLLQLTL